LEHSFTSRRKVKGVAATVLLRAVAPHEALFLGARNLPSNGGTLQSDYSGKLGLISPRMAIQQSKHSDEIRGDFAVPDLRCKRRHDTHVGHMQV
jgi:hypothetical protein